MKIRNFILGSVLALTLCAGGLALADFYGGFPGITAANIIAALTGNPLPIAQGGTSASTAAGALSALGGLPNTGVGLIEQITVVFDGGGSAILTTQKPVYVHRDYALTSINRWTVQCNSGASDSTPIVVTVGGKVTTASTSGALPTIAANGFCAAGNSGYYPVGNSSTPIAQAAWNAACGVQGTSANTDFIFSVYQAPTASTWCSATLEVTR